MTEHDLTTPDGLAVYLRAQMKGLGPGDPRDAFQVILVELLAELFKRVKVLEPKDRNLRGQPGGRPETMTGKEKADGDTGRGT